MFLLFSLTCSQIWLSPLLNGLQPTYLTNLTKKTHYFFLALRANLHLRTLMIIAGRSSNWISCLAD